jgi:hypothetical protein
MELFDEGLLVGSRREGDAEVCVTSLGEVVIKVLIFPQSNLTKPER